MISCTGKDNPLSTFYKCDIKVFGEKHSSAEHAFQQVKAVRCGDLIAADKIRGASSPIDARRIGNCVTQTDAWMDERETVMEEILKSKMDQVADFKIKLKESNKNTVFAETTYDMEWGTGLNASESVKTKSSCWPGQNKMGRLVKKVASMCVKRRQSSVNKIKTAKQRDIGVMLKDIKDNRGLDDTGSASDSSSDEHSV